MPGSLLKKLLSFILRAGEASSRLSVVVIYSLPAIHAAVSGSDPTLIRRGFRATIFLATIVDCSTWNQIVLVSWNKHARLLTSRTRRRIDGDVSLVQVC